MAQDTLQRLIRAEGQSRSARTVEVFGWMMLAEAAFAMLTPHGVAALLHLPMPDERAANHYRLVGLLAGGLTRRGRAED